MQNAARTYIQTQVNTTSQGDILILLFDAAVKYLTQAKEKIAERNYAQKGILISKAMDILTELQGSLNAQKGGELAGNLQRLYFYCNTQLLKANLKMDVNIIDEVLQILSGLRDAFNQANAQFDAKAQAAQAAAPPPVAPTLAAQAHAVSCEETGKPSPGPNVYAIPRRQPAPSAPASPAAAKIPASKVKRYMPEAGQASSPRPAQQAQQAQPSQAAPAAPTQMVPPTARTVKKAFAAYSGAQPPQPKE